MKDRLLALIASARAWLAVRWAWFVAHKPPFMLTVLALIIHAAFITLRLHHAEDRVHALQSAPPSYAVIDPTELDNARSHGRKLGAPILTFAGDLAGSTMTSQVVAGLTGSAGVVTMNATSLQAAAANSTLNLGTNKAGATLALQADAAANVLQLAGGTQNGYILGAAPATAGHMRTPAGFDWISRNAANTNNYSVLGVTTADQIYIGDSGGVTNVTIHGGGSPYFSLTSSFIDFSGGNDTYIDGATVHIRNGANAETNTLVPNSAYGMQITGGLGFTTRTVTASATVDSPNPDRTINVDTTAGILTVTLPTPTFGRELIFTEGGARSWATHNWTLARHGTETLNGASVSLTAIAGSAVSGQAEICRADSYDGTNWISDCH